MLTTERENVLFDTVEKKRTIYVADYRFSLKKGIEYCQKNFVVQFSCANMSLNLPINDLFYEKQPTRARRRRLQESSRLGQKHRQQELQPLPSLKGRHWMGVFVFVKNFYHPTRKF